jgi:hypothetical protein
MAASSLFLSTSSRCVPVVLSISSSPWQTDSLIAAIGKLCHDSVIVARFESDTSGPGSVFERRQYAKKQPFSHVFDNDTARPRLLDQHTQNHRLRPSGRGTRRCKSRLDRLDSPVVDRRIREVDDRLRILRQALPFSPD